MYGNMKVAPKSDIRAIITICINMYLLEMSGGGRGLANKVMWCRRYIDGTALKLTALGFRNWSWPSITVVESG